MTENQDTTRAALQHDSEAMPSTAADAGLDQAADRLLAASLDNIDRARPLVLTDPEDDPVYRMGAQLGRLVARHSALDNEHEGTDRAKRDREFEMHRLDGSCDVLRDAATYQTASSIPGALAHLVVASQFLSDINENGDLDADGREWHVKAVRRCLYSATQVLAVIGGVSPRVFGSDYMLPRHLDEMGLAMAPIGTPRIPTGPKPTVEDGAVIALGLVEQTLTAMNERADVWWALYEEAGRMEDQNSHNPERDPARLARHKMGDMAEGHARRRWQELFRRAIALPATTPRELGLQARLIAAELDEWWDDDEGLGDGEIACRLLLDRLAAMAGMPRIERSDVEPAEIRDWLDHPEKHAETYRPEPRE